MSNSTIAAFGEYTGLCADTGDEINQIKANDPAFTEFCLYDRDAKKFSDLSWELLGSYIAQNEHLDIINLVGCNLTDSEMSLLFRNWTRSDSLKEVNISGNMIGIVGIRSMVSFLKNARNLRELCIGDNRDTNTECFRVLVEALHSGGGTIEALRLWSDKIEDITALERYPLPHLRYLVLDNNNIRRFPTSLENYTNLEELHLRNNQIGREGFRSIANLLEKDSSRVKYLDLDSTDMCDEDAEVIANSLTYNTSLTDIHLEGSVCSRRDADGHRAFLKLVNDVSSIERTHNSNHTLKTLSLPRSTDAAIQEFKTHIDCAMRINKYEERSHGRAKVVEAQLNSDERMELCHLQGIGYSYGSIFAEIEPILLPEVFALVGERYGQDELYQMLITAAPDLVSIVNRRAVIKERIAEKSARIAALEAEVSAIKDEVHELNGELASFESEETHKPMIGRKRGRENL